MRYTNTFSSVRAIVLFIILFFTMSSYAQTISTFAGGIGDDSSATAYARINTNVNCVATDRYGNFYFGESNSSYGEGRIRKVTPTGIIKTIIGNGFSGKTNDNRPAVSAQAGIPSGIVIDRIGNIYFSDSRNHYIRKVDTFGIITTFAGIYTSGYAGAYSGDGSVANTAAISYPMGMAFDTIGNLYFADKGNNRVRKVDTSGIITTIAGTGSIGFSGDGGSAIYAKLYAPTGVACDSSGNIYIADQSNYRIRKVNSSGIISTFAGTGTSGFSGDGSAATAAQIMISDIRVGSGGSVLFSAGSRIRKINSSGIISTVAGTSTAGFSGDGGSATAATFSTISDLCLDAAGDLFIADNTNKRVRKVNTSGIVNTVAGGYSYTGRGDGMPATYFTWAHAVTLFSSIYGNFSVPGIATDTAGNVYYTQVANNVVRKIDRSGIVSTIAGNWSAGFYGDGGAATAAALDRPVGVACDNIGNVYVADYGNHHIRKVDASGTITSIAGGGTSGLGDGGPATDAILSAYGLWVDSSRNIYVADCDSSRIRKINGATGTISTIAGNGSVGLSGDGGPATAAAFRIPMGVTVDRYGSVYIADYGNQRVRKVDTFGIISTFAGGAPGGFSYWNYEGGLGDGGPATAAQMYLPQSVLADTAGNIYIADKGSGTGNAADSFRSYFSRVRKVDKYGYIHTVAGDGKYGYSGDGGPAAKAQFSTLMGLALDRSMNLYIGDNNQKAIRRACCMTYNADRPPLFTAGASSPLNLCIGTSSVSLNSLLSISDGDVGDTLKWTVNAVPAHGTLSGFTYTTVSTGGTVTPSGLVFTPTSSYSGVDTFSIKVSDGIDYSIFKVYVNIVASPTGGTISGPSTLCVGDTATYVESVAGGRWSSLYGRITVTSAGLVTAVSAGIDTLVYTDSNSCGTATARMRITVNVPPTAGIISGASVVCVGTSITLASSVSGGSWSTRDPYITIGSGSGVVSGVASGTAIITYTMTNSCGTATDTALITVNPGISAGTITGSSSVCIGSSTTLSTTGTGGAWSSSNTSIATISSSGLVMGVSGGAALISYTVTSSCGTAVAIALINVNTSSSIGAITGPSAVCSGSAITLSHASSGGTWSSSGTAIATVSSGGVVTGLTPGVATISYTVSAGCGVSVATINITVSATPTAGTLGGPASLCIGATASVTSSSTGGAWSTSSGSVATVNSAGVVLGIGAGTAVFTYTVTNSCGSASASRSITVSPAPTAGTVSGPSTVCAGSSITLSTSGSGGVWNSGSTGIATVSTGGIVTGLASGTATISYTVTTGCGIASATAVVTVNAASAGTITGVSTLCPSATSTLSSTISGGTWSTSTVSVASISASGTVSAAAPGTAIISYTTSGTCGTAISTATVMVMSPPSVAAIGGTMTVCIGGTTMLSDATTGGAWSSGSTAVATISASGTVTGLSAGTAVISYSVTGTCGTASATAAITILGPPSAGTLSGAATLCSGSATALTPTATGGTWSSSNITIATVNTGGIITGLTSGTATISYSVTNSCGTGTATHSLTINPLPNAGIISGSSSVCVGSSITLTDAVSGGSWSSSSPSVASISSSGSVRGVSAGSAVISYAVTNSCGTAYATYTVAVNGTPSSGTISSVSAMCTGTSVAFATTASGGTWSTSSAAVATVNAAGIVTGLTSGTAVISYTVSNACGSSSSVATVVVSAGSGGTITGITTVCVGSGSTLSSTISGGAWSSSTPSVATISSSGAVSALAAGTSVISYSVSGSCGSFIATAVFTVNTAPSVAAITGTTTICAGATTTLADATSGGSWSSGATSIASINSSGLVRGMAAGIATISYTVTGACGATSVTTVVTVQTTPSAGTISGMATLCSGTTATLSSTISGGSWSSGTPGVATISSSGFVTALTAGTTVMSYAVTNSCGTTMVTYSVTVTTTPAAGSVSGITTFCEGDSSLLSATASGGMWSSSNPAVATVSSTGVVTGASAGSAIISYTLSNACGSASATTMVTINPTPHAGTITGASSIVVGSNTTLANAVPGGAWSSSNTAVATISTTGIVTGVSAGSLTITYTVANAFGCSAFTTYAFTVNPSVGIADMANDRTYQLFPNPTTGEVAVTWEGMEAGDAVFTLTDALGRVVLNEPFSIVSANGQLNVDLTKMAAGMYVVRIAGGKGSYCSKLVLE